MKLLPPSHLRRYNRSLSVFRWIIILCHVNDFVILVAILLRSSKVQLMMLKLYCATGMALVLIASILLAEFCSVLSVAVIHRQHFVRIFSFLFFVLESYYCYYYYSCYLLLSIIIWKYWLAIYVWLKINIQLVPSVFKL